MSDTMLAFLITVGIFAGLLAWVPFLHGCAHCSKRVRDGRARRGGRPRRGEETKPLKHSQISLVSLERKR